MKKTLIIFAGILIGLYVVLSVMGSKGEYVAERELERINAKFRSAARDPKAVPDATFTNILRKYERFVKRFPESKLTPSADLMVGKVHKMKGDNDKSIEVFEKLSQKYTEQQEIAVLALVEIGKIHYANERWKDLLDIYYRIIEEYPATIQGLQTPLLVANFHMQRQELDLAQKAYSEAVLHYRDLAKVHANTFVEFDALRSISICYMAQKRWEEAVVVLGEALNKFPEETYWNVERFDKVVKSINTISLVTLKNYDLPVKIYTEFIENNPDHKFTPIFKRMIESQNLLKEKNIRLDVK